MVAPGTAAGSMLIGNARVGDRDVDLLIVDGRIARIGSIGRADLDLEGRWLLPGLWDEHVHVTQWALTSRRLDVGAATSAADTAALVAATAGTDLLVGGGFRDGLWPDEPTADLLDRAAPARAVVLISADLHSAWINTAATRVLGVSDTWAGLLRERAAFEVAERVARVDEATLDGWVGEAMHAAAARGIVGVVDLEMSWIVDAWQRRLGRGHDATRVQAGVYPHDLDRAIDLGYRTGDVLDPLLTVGGLKIITDGSLGTRTAATVEPYGDGAMGELTVEPGELEALVRRASAAGLEPWVHAIGDRANTHALDVFEAVGVGGRIEHAQLLSEADFPRFAALGVTASVQPEHAVDDRDLADAVWPDRTDRLYAFRSLLDAGAELRFGSDAPVATLDPWAAIAAAVTRTRGDREPWHPEQRISPEEALAASARTTVAEGQPADLIAVEADPFAPDGANLRGMPVAVTLLGGRITHGLGAGTGG